MMFWQPASTRLPPDEGNVCAEVVGGKLAHAVAYPNLCIGGNGLSVAAFLDGITKRFGGIVAV